MSRYDNFITKSERNYQDRVANVYIHFVDEPRDEIPIQLVKISEIGDMDLYFQRPSNGDIRIIKGNIFKDEDENIEVQEQEIINQILKTPFLAPGIVLRGNEKFIVYRDLNNELKVKKM
jgi:hypothetical protein